MKEALGRDDRHIHSGIDAIVYSGRQIQILKAAGVNTTGFRQSMDVSTRQPRGLFELITEWRAETEDGLIALPWAVQTSGELSVPESSWETEIERGMNGLERDLGCFQFVKHSKENLMSSEYKNGILFVHGPGKGCMSQLGMVDGGMLEYRNLEPADLGMPDTWQLITLEDGCGGTSESTVQEGILQL